MQVIPLCRIQLSAQSTKQLLAACGVFSSQSGNCRQRQFTLARHTSLKLVRHGLALADGVYRFDHKNQGQYVKEFKKGTRQKQLP
jgi:hypothetical protein